MKKLAAFLSLLLALAGCYGEQTGATTANPVLFGPPLNQISVATWAIQNSAGTAIARYYAVDNENGSDSNACSVDAPVGTTFTTELTSVACKTSERIREILPRFGAGRTAVILFKGRSDNANYLKKDGVTSDWLDIGYSGYNYIAFRGSDLTNSTSDHADLNGRIGETGPNGDGSWTVNGFSGWTVTVSSGTLSARDTITGLKVQYKGNVTAALRTRGATLVDRLGNTTFDIGRNLGAGFVPVANDEFFLMRPTVKFTKHLGQPSGATQSSTGAGAAVVVAGMEFSATTVNAFHMPIQQVFVRYAGTMNQIGISTASSYMSEDTTTFYLLMSGCDFRGTTVLSGNFAGLTGVNTNAIRFSAFHGTTTIFGTGPVFVVDAVYFNGTPLIEFMNGSRRNAVGERSMLIGTESTAERRVRAVGGINLRGFSGTVSGVDIDGATNGFVLTGEGNSISFSDVVGTATTSAIDMSGTTSSTIDVGSSVTAAGTTQDVLMAGSVVATFASLATSGQYDNVGNQITGSGGLVVKKTVLKFSGEHIGAAGAVISYLADEGKIAAGALATAIAYPMPASRMRNLRIRCATNALAANMTATVYKNGSSCNIVATVTTGATTLFSDTTHECQFAAGDTFDLRLDSTGGGVNTAECSASVEQF